MIESFDYNYFDGDHPAGMSGYYRSPVYEVGASLAPFDFFAETHWNLYQKHQDLFDEKKVLFLGCAKGFDVQDFRTLGVDAYGIDISDYAISQADSDILEYIAVGDAVSSDVFDDASFDVFVGLRFLPCLTDLQLASLSGFIVANDIPSVFLVDVKEGYSDSEYQVVKNYYNVKTLNEWQLLFPTSIIEPFEKTGKHFK